MAVSMHIYEKSVDMDMGMDLKFYVHGKPVYVTLNCIL